MKRAGQIGVICRPDERPWVEEFFQLFKTPWEFYVPDKPYAVVISTGNLPANVDCLLAVIYSSDADRGATEGPTRVIRAGYNLFAEIAFLLSKGQPDQNALTPLLDVYIATLRDSIVGAGLPLVEIPPAPAGYEFIGCLTHDVDFLRITDHKFDGTAFGFIGRTSAGSVIAALRRSISWRQCIENIKALALLPAVHLGLSDDFWFRDFKRFMEIEQDMKATYFFIPFKSTPGEKVAAANPGRRAAAYDVTNEKALIQELMRAGHEVAVHGIDAWHDTERGRAEYSHIANITIRQELGVRMHWLCFDESSPRILEDAGFRYDSTAGYNRAIGYRAGTHQVFKPKGATTLLELPLHIQDTALLQAGRFAFRSPDEALERCRTIIDNAARYGGVLTLLWHTRSLAPERQWGSVYTELLNTIRAHRVWFGTAGQVVDWFRVRRAVSFRDVDISAGRVQVAFDITETGKPVPALAVRVHKGIGNFQDIPWTGAPIVRTAFAEPVRA
jgi:hypothetical protein